MKHKLKGLKFLTEHICDADLSSNNVTVAILRETLTIEDIANYSKPDPEPYAYCARIGCANSIRRGQEYYYIGRLLYCCSACWRRALIG